MKVHFIGIKGVGVSAIALVLHDLGYQVTGSDVADSYGETGQILDRVGIPTSNGFDANNITEDIALVVVGASFGSDNPEITRTHELNLPIRTSSEALQWLTENKKLLAVSGTHGKTTTTSLLTYILKESGFDPSWIIGTTQISGLPAHGGAGTSDYFVLEADEYKKAADDLTPKFLDYTPYGLILNNVEHDHPDVYPTFDSFKVAFAQLLLRIRPDGFVVANGDDEAIRELLRESLLHVSTYGYSDWNNYIIEDLESPSDETRFALHTETETFGPFSLSLMGKHNVYNAAAAIVMALRVGVPEDAIKTALPAFKTVERRYQKLGNWGNTIIIDDFAHHPTAIQTTLETAKKQYPDRPLWVAFQAHTYSRTQTLLSQFATCFTAADTVIITDIFASAREKEVTITGEDLAQAIGKNHADVRFIPETELYDYLLTKVPNGAVLIVMGASKINEIGLQLVDK